ncbi:hypothetical protein JTB14_036056 [Gonioctena quinquepunctata]|nr:hypothetical protein JTB14_036056 [Gonioctena quinquepunctata]
MSRLVSWEDCSNSLKDRKSFVSYLRFLPKNSASREEKRHTSTAQFASASIRYLESLLSFLGPNEVFFLSQVDKAQVPIRLTAASKHFYKISPTKEVDQEQMNQEQPRAEETQIDREHENVATGKEQLEEKSEDITMNSDKAKDEQVESECGYQKYDYVIIIYENKYFPGQVIDTDKTKFFIKALERIGIHWRWPTIEDVIWYEEDEIVSRISTPRLINKRGFYSVPEIKDMD